MANDFLQAVNELFSEKIDGSKKSPKKIYDQLSQFFRIPNKNEDDILLTSGNVSLPCRYSNPEVFRNQIRRITNIDSNKLSRKKKDNHPELRLTINSLLTLQLFSILNIDINEFLGNLESRLECEKKEPDNQEYYDDDKQVEKLRKESYSVDEIFYALLSACANIYFKIEAVSQIGNFKELSDTNINTVNLFYDQLFHDIQNLEKYAETNVLEKSQIKALKPKLIKNLDNDEDKEETYFSFEDLLRIPGAHNTDTINYIEIRPQLYIYASYLMISIMLNLLKRIQKIQKTGNQQEKSLYRITCWSFILKLNKSDVKKVLNEKGGTSKLGTEIVEKDILPELLNSFTALKHSFDKLLSYFSKTTSTSFDDIREEKNLRTLLLNLTKVIVDIFENKNLNFRRPKLHRYDSIQDIIHSSSIFDYTFDISKEKLECLKQLEENTNNLCNEIIKEITRFETFEEPLMSSLQKNAQDYIFKSWKEGINPIIALDMGCGKTRVACTTIKRFINENKDENGYILVVIPAGLKEDWRTELDKNNNLKNCVYLFDNNREKYFDSKTKQVRYVPLQVFVTSYDIAALDSEKYKTNPPVMIIYDELQLINTGNILEKCLVLAELNESVKYKFALSGTPMQNETTEFFVNYCFFHDSKLLTNAYKSNLIKQSSWESEESFKKVKQDLTSKNYYFFGREDQKLKLDEKFIPLVIAENHFNGLIDFNKKEHQKEMQYLLNPRDFGFEFDSTKTLFIKQLVKELASRNEKVIVFSYYKKPLRYLYNELKKYNPSIAIGKSLDDDDSSEIIDLDSRKEIEKFKDPKNKSMVLLGTIKMIGTGENLEVANHLIILDLWWNPMVIIQAMYRIKRKSQTKPVHIYFPIYTDKKGSPIDSEKNYLETMNRKIKSYNSFLTSIGYEQYANRALPKITLKEPLFFDQNASYKKDWLLEEIQTDEKTKVVDWFKDSKKKFVFIKKKD